MSNPPSLFGNSDAYERFMGRWSRRLAPRFVEFATVDVRRSVLDVGSGTGALTSAIIETTPSVRVTGVERSDAFARYAATRVSTRRAAFVVADAQALPFPAASFEMSLSLLVFNFIPDPDRALSEVIRVTRSGGRVAAAVWDYGDGMQMLRAFWDAAVAIDPTLTARDESQMRLCRRGEMAALWRAHGLRHVEEHPLVIEQRFESFDDYWLPFLGGQGPAGALAVSLSDAARAALASELRWRLRSSPGSDAFTLEARAWAVSGVVPDTNIESATP